MKAEDIFLAALEKNSPSGRQAYLDGACGTNADLRAQVEGLLDSNEKAGSFLDAPLFDPPPTTGQPVHERPSTVIGPYKLMEEIGEGGFGLVFVAEQRYPLRRKVAVKVIKPGMDTREVIARFDAERQALALMDHPNIARVFDGGAAPSGRPYFVMELVKGVPITEFCDHNRLPIRQRLQLFIDVCQAIQHAHQKGVIHRDLKPANIMVSLQDATPVVKVIDFGVAKAIGYQLTEKTVYTSFTQMIGTPVYMSPEQAGMSGLDIDTRTDIYALGVLLYELLTGTTPFDKQRLRTVAYEEIRRIIREEDPPRPSTRFTTLGQVASTVSENRKSVPKQLSQLCRGDLDWIVMKALEKDRNRRYESASAFAADVQRYLRDEPVHACPPSTLYRLRKLARRHTGALVTLSAVALAALLAVTALAFSTGLVWRANQELRSEVYFQRITVAQRELSTDNLAATLRALQECPEDLRQWEWRCLMRLCKVEPLVVRVQTEVMGAVFSPDGERLASAGGDGAVKIWNSWTGQLLQTLPAHSDSVASVAFHADGKHVATLGADRKVKVWDLTTASKPVFTETCNSVRKFGTAYTVAFSPDGQQLAAGTEGAVTVWDWKNHQPLQNLPGHNFHSIPVAFSGDGRLATGTYREGLKLWDVKTGRLLHEFYAHRHPVSALAFSPGDKWLASASFDRTVKLQDSTTGKVLHTFELHTGNVECVAFSPDGRRIASGGEDKTVRVWDVTSGREVLGLRGHTGRCGCVAFSPDGMRLASASTDGTIRVWDASPLRGNEGQEILTFTRHTDEVRSLAFSPDGQRIASAGTDGFVKVWDVRTGSVGLDFTQHDQVVFCVAWHPDGRRIASAGSEHGLHSVKVWDSRQGQSVFEIQSGPERSALPYSAVAFSPDGRYLVTGKVNGAVQLCDAGTGQEFGTLASHDREIRGIVFSRDGQQLATASSDGKVKLWDATQLDQQQAARRTLSTRVPGPSLNVAFCPDGRRVATGSEENTVKIWDAQDGRELKTLRGHSGEVYTVAFSPDDEGRWIASAGEDSAVKVWDSHTGRLIRTFRGHTGLVSCLAFSPDGRRLATGSRDKTVKIWDVTKLENGPDR